MEEEMPSSFSKPEAKWDDNLPKKEEAEVDEPKPDKKVRKHKREHKVKEPKKKRIQKVDDDITISINPLMIGKIALVVLAVFVLFFAGRYSTISSTCEIESASEFFGALSEVSGAATGETIKTETVEVAPVVTEEPAAEPTPEPEAEPEAEVEEEPTAEPKDESVVTEYKDVGLAIDDAYLKWMETWGKITGVKYTITNAEKGTIKPDHFVMLVEGYGDITKTFDVGYKSVKITSDTILTDEAAVSGGFAYNEVTAGDLTNVQITLQLYDASDNLIASTNKQVDLSG